MSYLDALSEEAKTLLRTAKVSEYATVSKAGVPIDTPTYLFPKCDLTTLDIATGLAYPAKAERARANPSAGLLVEGGEDEPVISIAGYAAVRDANLQANLERYVRETITGPEISPALRSWDLVRRGVHYLTRVFVEVTPVHVRWWPNRAAMSGRPEEWIAPPGSVFPAGDPRPIGNASAAPNWPTSNWQDLAAAALTRGGAGHLTICDANGFPLPYRALEIRGDETGFLVIMPKAIPWTAGKATLSFQGREVFVGDVTRTHGVHRFRVERALPILPLLEAERPVERPAASLREALMGRLAHEAARRGQVIPTVPKRPPEPTRLALLRQGRQAVY